MEIQFFKNAEGAEIAFSTQYSITEENSQDWESGKVNCRQAEECF